MMYFIQVIIYTAILYGIYLFCLKDRASHRLSRAFLLLTAFVPLVLPLVRVRWTLGDEAGAGVTRELLLPLVTVTDRAREATTFSVFDVSGGGVLCGYVAISMTVFLYFIYRQVRLWRFIRRHEVVETGGMLLVKHTGCEPGSWFRYVLLPGAETDSAVLRHEAAHVRLHHSVDLLLLQVLRSFCWVNVLLVFITRELKMVHEFQADEAASADKTGYARLLLDHSFHTRHFSLVNHFFHHPLKRRIMMLQHNEQKNRKGWYRVAAISLSCLTLGAIVAVQGCDKSQLQDKTVKDQAVKSPDVLTMAAEMPRFPGGESEMIQFIGANLQYPESAQKRKIEGRVVVKFVVNKDGTLRDAQIAKSPDPSLSSATLALLAKMPKWEPGRDEHGNPVSVYMTLPVSFKM